MKKDKIFMIKLIKINIMILLIINLFKKFKSKKYSIMILIKYYSKIWIDLIHILLNC
jgi:hypothetical protein